MKRVVSISLGSSSRDHCVETTLLGQRIRLERIGTNGDQKRARRHYLELDGKVDAFGVGGADLGITVNGHYYPLHSITGLVKDLKSPAVDGGGLRELLEGRIAQRMDQLLPVPPHPRRVFVCTGVARYDMSRSFVDAGYEVLFGDIGFNLGLPIPMRSIRMLERVGRILIPIMSYLPFEMLYPTGEKQSEIVPKFAGWYQWAGVIADDFHYIKKHLPPRLEGKIVVTNTTTLADVELLRDRGVAYLVTLTPRLEGRTFGTNVLEAALTAIAGKGRPLTCAEMAEMVGEDNLQPTILPLNTP
jgi:hypothetical protein